MPTLTSNDIQAAEASAGGQPGKPSLKRLLGCLAIGQILRDEYVYEVHGPFVAEEPAPPSPRLAAWMIAKLVG